MLDNPLSAILANGPKLSSIVAKELEMTTGVSSSAARKRIERAKVVGDICALENLKFRRNEQFLYLPAQYGSSEFRAALLEALESSKSLYRFPLRGLAARGGIVPVEFADTFTGLPILQKKGPNSSRVIEELISLDLIEEVENSVGKCFRLSETFGPNILSEKRLMGRLAAERIVLAAVADWFSLQGMISPGQVHSRFSASMPQFGFFRWDFVCPSYLLPLVDKPKGKLLNGFIVADVILGRKLTLQDIEYFSRKVLSINAKPNNRPFIPILIADWFEKEAFSFGKKAGYVLTTPKNFFGNQFSLFLDLLVQEVEVRTNEVFEYQSLMSLSNTLTNFQHLPAAFSELKKMLMAILIGYLKKERASRTASLKYEFSTTNEFDVDVITFEPYKYHRLTSLAAKETVTATDLKNWLQTTVVSRYEKLSQDNWFQNASCSFELWSTGHFDKSALEYFQSIDLKKLPFSLELMPIELLRLELGELEDSVIDSILIKYF